MRMKHSLKLITLVTAAIALGAAGIAWSLDINSLSSADASAGLKKALDQGIDHAVSELGGVDGFLKNPKVKIDLPPKLAKAEGMMKMVGLGDQVDALVTAMNRAAEAAVPEGKALLKQALKQMSVQDAKQILTGGDDAATQYFKRVTYAPLKVKFTPIVTRETQKVQLGQRYDAVAQKAVSLGVLKPDDASLEGYVTDRTLDGLFLIMADEERAIRKDPLGQASNLLKKVFGAVH
jgi:Protein of unknown function (DUF4197)